MTIPLLFVNLVLFVSMANAIFVTKVPIAQNMVLLSVLLALLLVIYLKTSLPA